MIEDLIQERRKKLNKFITAGVNLIRKNQSGRINF